LISNNNELEKYSEGFTLLMNLLAERRSIEVTAAFPLDCLHQIPGLVICGNCTMSTGRRTALRKHPGNPDISGESKTETFLLPLFQKKLTHYLSVTYSILSIPFSDWHKY